MTDKELVRVLNKEIKAGRKWIRLAYKYPDDDSKTEPALRSWLRAIEATDKAKAAR